MAEALAVLDRFPGFPADVTRQEAPPSLEVQTDPAQRNDYDLTREASAGNAASFEEIYRRHSRRVYGICLRMTGNATEAEDLTQDTFAHLFRKIGSFRGSSAFTTWLHRLTVNQVLMHFRRRRARPELVTDDGEPPVEIARGSENPNRMPVVDRIALEQAVAQLPEGYRRVFLLHDVEGYEHEEIARMLGVAAGTSKSQLHKARMKLRTLIKQQAIKSTED